MSQPVIFYSWQSDLPRDSTRDVIRHAASDAIAHLATQLSIEDSPRLDHDTLGDSGTPAIMETIYRKIRQSAVFVADVTPVGQTGPKDGRAAKKLSNGNVLIELGYAAATLGWERIVLVMNKHYGSPESLPFDLRYRRFPLTFDLGPNSARREAVLAALGREMEGAIRACFAAEYERIDEVLSRLSSYARSLIIKHGADTQFWETAGDNAVLSRLDLAISQLLDVGVIRCVQAATESGLAYTWTYLGRQCALRLGVQPRVLHARQTREHPPSVTCDLSSYESLGVQVEAYRFDVVSHDIPPRTHQNTSQHATEKKHET